MKNVFGQKILHLDSVDSTNNYTAILLKDGKLIDGTVILTDEQTNGRGQMHTKWETTPGLNLTVSFFKEFDNLSVNHQFYISKWFAYSVVQMLTDKGINAQIKWPNDIYVNTCKLGGILIETQLRGEYISSAIIGLGLNVNQEHFDESLRAISIKSLLKNHLMIEEVLFSLIARLNANLEWLSPLQIDTIDRHYFQNLLGFGKIQRFEINGELREGKITNVLQNGFLEVLFADTTKHFDLKEIKFVFDE